MPDEPRPIAALRVLVGDIYGFAERGRSTLDRVSDAWLASKGGAQDAVTSAVVEDLGRDLVAQAFFDLHRSDMLSPQFAHFAAAVEAVAADSIGATLLASFTSELDGDARATKRHLDAVLADEPNHGTALLRSMILAIDQSRYDDALGFNGRLFGRDEDQAGPLPAFAGAMVSAGRNDPCPCGTGRKYKQCHQGTPLLGEPQATQALAFKVARFTDDRAYADQFGAEPDAAQRVLQMIDDPALRDVVVYEGGFLARYLTERGSFLPADEAARLERWAGADRRLFRIDDVHTDLRLTVRDVATDEVFDMAEAVGAGDVYVGEHRWMRIEQHAGAHLPVGVIFKVDDARVDEVRALIDDGPVSLDAMVRWLRS